MRCSNCGFENADASKFCIQCGTAAAKHCGNCGFANPPAARFCGGCAAALLHSPADKAPDRWPRHVPNAAIIKAETGQIDREGERKTLTALFADIKGSTELMRDLDPEEARGIIDPALRLMIAAVRSFEGYVVQSTGDGIFALFGAPIAHEDHPQRAVHAALAMQEALKEYALQIAVKGRAPLQVRVGVNTGEVVVREIHTGGRVEYTPIGHTANLAARLQTLAPAGSIAVSEQTRRLIDGYFELRPLGELQAKGLDAPLPAYEVIGPGPLQSHFQVALGRGLTRFVGRGRELQEIVRALELARAGHGQIVAIIGEPGVGKSRLLHEFKQSRPADWLMLEAGALSHGAGVPYHLVIELLQNLFRLVPEDSQRQRLDKVESRVALHDLSDTLPYLCPLLSLPADAAERESDPRLRRRRTVDAVKRLLLAESRTCPILMVLEDLHWLDRDSLFFLSIMGSSITNASVLGLVTFRPEFRHEFANRSYYTQIRLNPLDSAEARQMLQDRLGAHAALNELEEFAIEKSEGNPFFIEEILQALFDQGVLVREDTARLARPLIGVRIPATVQGIIASRIDRLSAEHKELLQTMAVIGRRSPLTLLKRLVPWPDDQLERMLAELQFLEFVHEQITASEPEYVLKHALTQDVAYNSLLLEQRALLHERAGQAIEALHADRLEEKLDELAHHYGRGGNNTKAVHYLHLAGRQALACSALANAVTMLNRALELLDGAEPSGQRAQQELELRLLLGPALMASEGYGSSEVEQVYSRARDLCAMLGETPQLCAVLYGLFSFYSARAIYRTAGELADQMLRLADNLKAPTFLVLASFAAGQTQVLLGQPEPSRRTFERTAASYSREHQHELMLLSGFDCGIAAIVWDALAMWTLGYPDGALSRVEQAAALARESSNPHSLTYTLFFRAWLCHFRREWGSALDGAQTVLALAQEHGLPLWTLWATTLGASAMVEQGQADQGREQLAHGLSAIRAAGARITMTQTLGLAAQAHARCDDPHEGLALIDEALTAAESTGERYYVAELHRLRGELILQADASDVAQAERWLRTSMAIARGQNARSWELRGATSLARLLARLDRRSEARTILEGIYGRFSEGFDTLDLKDARAMLDELQE